MTLLIVTIIIALGFEITNAFHDTANSIATTVSTKVLTPKKAILLASVFNLIGALMSNNVAKTISSGLTLPINSQLVIISALVAAIVWNLVTWHFGLPSSSSHAIIGGLLGASITYAGFNIVKWGGVVTKVLIPIITSPVLGFIIALIIIKVLNTFTVSDNKWFKKLQILSATFMAYAHGSNDASKTMGIITMALVSSGFYTGTNIPVWVIILCAVTMAIGTSFGGWKIIRTMGDKITTLDNKQGFVAETSAAIVIESMSVFAIPVSTTHVISSSIIGVGASKGKESVAWNIVTNMLSAWILTIPVTAVLASIILLIIN